MFRSSLSLFTALAIVMGISCGKDENPIKESIGTIALANEISVRGTLKTIAAAEATFMMDDADGNGRRDYWTADVSGLARLCKPNGGAVNILDPEIASADGAPLPEETGFMGRMTADKPLPKAGYLVRAMENDEAGTPYNQNVVNGVPRANPSKFAVCAYPEEYAITGKKTFIIDQDGKVFKKDTGGKPVLQWPDNPSTQGWSIE